MEAFSLPPFPPVPDSCYPYSSDELVTLLPPVSPSQSPTHQESIKLSSLPLPLETCYPPLSSPVYCYPPFDEEEGLLDWMKQDNGGLLLTPDDQDISLTSYTHPPLPLPYTSYSIPTPDSSSPSTPVQLREDPDILDALSLINDSPMTAANILPQFESHSPLPSPASFTSSPSSSSSVSYSYTDHTHNAFIPSPLSLSTQDLSPSHSSDSPSLPTLSLGSSSSPDIVDLTKSEDSIRYLLSQSHGDKDVTVETKSSGSAKTLSNSIQEETVASEPKGKRKKLTKSAKKERKKEQNKQAALRYRKRKRGETDEIDEKREELEAVNSELKRQVKAMETEVQYLKNLWMEVEAVRARRN